MTDFTISPTTTAVYRVPNIPQASADKAVELLRANYESFHVFFNFKGYHNHQVHYLLTAFALGADPSQLQSAFDGNVYYQRSQLPVDRTIVAKLRNPRFFKSIIGNVTYFNDYTAFFIERFKEHGWQKVVKDYLFSGDDLANDLLTRLHAGIVHPLIHLGFGIEFKQPPVIAEALARAACHNNFFSPFLLQWEQSAKDRNAAHTPPLLNLLAEIRADPSLYVADYWEGGDTLLDKILADAPPKVTEIASKYKVSVEDLELRTAEMINVNAFMLGAAQRPEKEFKLDLFFTHSVNCSIFFTAFNAQTWLTPEDKVRLLEWIVRMNILQYASRLAPEFLPEEIESYRPREPGRTWSDIIRQTNEVKHDDGHIPKLVRALAHGSRVTKPYEETPGMERIFPLNQRGWLQIGDMALDTTTDPTAPGRWVRGAGGARNWERFADR